MKSTQKYCQTIQSDDRGFVLVTSLIFMVILTIMGLAATKTTQFELNIAGNDRVAKVNFYHAESASMETAQELMNKGGASQELLVAKLAAPQNGGNQLIQAKDPDEPEGDIENMDLDNDGDFDDDDLALLQTSTMDSDNSTRKVAIQQGVDRGDSLNLRNNTMQVTYWSYGRSGNSGAVALIKMGVKRRVQTE